MEAQSSFRHGSASSHLSRPLPPAHFLCVSITPSCLPLPGLAIVIRAWQPPSSLPTPSLGFRSVGLGLDAATLMASLNS